MLLWVERAVPFKNDACATFEKLSIDVRHLNISIDELKTLWKFSGNF